MKKEISNWRTRLIGRDGDKHPRYIINMWEPNDIWVSQAHEDDAMPRIIIGINDIPHIVGVLKKIAEADRAGSIDNAHELMILEEWPRLVVYPGRNGRIYLNQDPGHGHHRRSFIYIDPGYDHEAVCAVLTGLHREVLTE